MNENNPNPSSESAASSSRAIERNHWSLYSTRAGWRDCANRLDRAMSVALQALDDKVADSEQAGMAARASNRGHTLVAAACKAHAWMLEVMREERNASMGAFDSEPIHRMERLICAHIKARYGVEINL